MLLGCCESLRHQLGYVAFWSTRSHATVARATGGGQGAGGLDTVRAEATVAYLRLSLLLIAQSAYLTQSFLSGDLQVPGLWAHAPWKLPCACSIFDGAKQKAGPGWKSGHCQELIKTTSHEAGPLQFLQFLHGAATMLVYVSALVVESLLKRIV